MVYEFEGRTEKEAIDRAAEELGLAKDGFDVEILETQRSGLFKKGFVRIQVHTNKPAPGPSGAGDAQTGAGQFASPRVFEDPESQNEFERKLVDFVEGLIERMGYGGRCRCCSGRIGKSASRSIPGIPPSLSGKRGRTWTLSSF
jgi:spoIIIJ-associated protein